MNLTDLYALSGYYKIADSNETYKSSISCVYFNNRIGFSKINQCDADVGKKISPNGVIYFVLLQTCQIFNYEYQREYFITRPGCY